MKGLAYLSLISIVMLISVLFYITYEKKISLFISGAEGTLASGRAFGVSIGGDAQAALSKLEGSGWVKSAAEEDLQFCDFHTFSRDSVGHTFVDRGWTRGTLQLCERDGVVMSIGWQFRPMAP